MSDDEEYYDEFDEDIFWIEDPDPEIADDLAATAHHDALFFDDPSLEAQDVYSDWDYLSDDYYDEDPTAEQRQRVIDGQLTAAADRSKEKSPAKKRRKQDTSTTQKSPEGVAQSLKPNTASFLGVLWKHTDRDRRPQLYEPGDGEKVALLKNWREVFRNSNPAIGRPRTHKQRALGYMNSDAGRSGVINGIIKDEQKREFSSDGTSVVSLLENLRETDADADADADSGDISTTTPAVSPAEREDPMKDSKSTTQIRPSAANGPDGNTSPKSAAPSSVRSKKRKAAESLEDQIEKGQNDAEDTKKPKSKRVASKKLSENTGPTTEPSSAPVRRSTRQAKGQK